MFLRRVISWPSRLHDGGTGAHFSGTWDSPSTTPDNSQHGPQTQVSRQAAKKFRRTRSTGVLRQDCFESHFKPGHIEDAVYYNDQQTIDAILARGGTHEVRAAIIFRVSGETIRKLYARGCRDQDFMNNLFSAARFDHPDVLEALLDHTGLTVHTLEHHHDGQRNSLLYAAAQAGHGRIVAQLLQRGADPGVGHFKRGLFGRHLHETSCLETAVRNCHATALRLLLQKVQPSTRELNELLNIAIRHEDRGCCTMLLQRGAKPGPAAQQRIEDIRDPLLTFNMRRALETV